MMIAGVIVVAILTVINITLNLVTINLEYRSERKRGKIYLKEEIPFEEASLKDSIRSFSKTGKKE